jgi:hypothetical protein
MKMAFISFLNSAKQTISGASTPAPGTPSENTPIHALFPKVDPAIDGDDCDHDCESCHVSLPRGFKIDEDDKLYGYVKGWSTHVLVATGKTDWVRDVADEKGSVMEAIEKKADKKPSNGVRLPSLQPKLSADYPTPLETHAISLKYTHALPLDRLLPANDNPPPTRLHHHRERHPKIGKQPHHKLYRPSSHKCYAFGTLHITFLPTRSASNSRTINVSSLSAPCPYSPLFTKDP